MDGLNFPPITGQHFGWAVIDEVVSRPSHLATRPAECQWSLAWLQNIRETSSPQFALTREVQ